MKILQLKRILEILNFPFLIFRIRRALLGLYGENLDATCQGGCIRLWIGNVYLSVVKL